VSFPLDIIVVYLTVTQRLTSEIIATVTFFLWLSSFCGVDCRQYDDCRHDR